MTFSKEVTLWCDGRNCSVHIKSTHSTVAEAREWAERERGWSCSPGEDRCARCR